MGRSVFFLFLLSGCFVEVAVMVVGGAMAKTSWFCLELSAGGEVEV